MLNGRFFEKERAVQERWFRLKFHIKFGRKLRALLFFRLHRRLEKEFRLTERNINFAIESTIREYRKVDGELFPATKQFFNMGLYFLLAERDVQALKADAFAHPSTAKRNIALRTLLLTIYEWDMGKVAGRRMNFIYEATGLSEGLKSAIVDALKDLKRARREVEFKLSEARHNTIAHRDADAMRQYEIISNLDVMAFSPVLTDFYSASDKLLKVMVAVMLEIGTMESLFRQVIHRKTCLNK